MEPTELLKLFLDAPLTLLLLYLLIKEQKEHSETRRLRDADNRQYAMDLSKSLERVLLAVDTLGRYMDKVEDSLNQRNISK